MNLFLLVSERVVLDMSEKDIRSEGAQVGHLVHF